MNQTGAGATACTGLHRKSIWQVVASLLSHRAVPGRHRPAPKEHLASGCKSAVAPGPCPAGNGLHRKSIWQVVASLLSHRAVPGREEGL
jgi:hypothetical protein